MVTMIGVRAAQPFDVQRILNVLEQRRLLYQEYRPGLWRKMWASHARQRPELERRLRDGRHSIALVHDQGGEIAGFIMGTLEPGPEADAPGLTCLVDDFEVAAPDLWKTVGLELINSITRQARARGAVRTVVICDHLDRLKRTMLALSGYAATSEWYVKSINF